MGLKLSFHGGAGTVTGSRHLVDLDGTRMLVDAGLFQGLKKLRLRNWSGPGFDPAKVGHLMLTHAHIDHSGYLPRLVRNGFRGPVHCTPATRDLAEILLKDSARLQEEDAEYANRKGHTKHRPALPLYTSEDAERAIGLMSPTDWGTWVDCGDGIRSRFHNMGHILGSAMVETQVEHGDRTSTIVFSGDVGRFDVPLHSNPDPLPACDVLVVESTYGDRDHEHRPVAEQILDAVLATVDRGGTVLIPSFAVGRTQLITLSLRELINEGRMPDLPIHIDSPMAVNATKLYTKYMADPTVDAELLEDGRQRLFPKNVHFHRTVAESKALNRMKGPRIVISASGMLAGGRVLHHLRRLLPDPKNLVMLVGYQAAGTRGRRMMEGAKTIRIHGQDIPVRAQFTALGGLSAHADRGELVRWIESAATPPATVFVVHGEPDSSSAFAQLVERKTGARCFTPDLGAVYDLDRLDN